VAWVLGGLAAFLVLYAAAVPALALAGRRVALVLRLVLRSGGRELLHEHWPGPERSRDVIERLAFRR
jgi:hypothetical protein